MEDTEAGKFLKQLNLEYYSGYSLISILSQKLLADAVLVDSYIEEEVNYSYRWKIYDITIIEHRTVNEEFTSISFEIPFNKDGIDYYELIGEKANQLKKDREYKCSVVIESKRDKCRLFLCGFGRICEYIILMDGV